MTVALKAVSICMDSDHYDQSKLGRYGKTGYLFHIRCPINPETEEDAPGGIGTVEPNYSIAWNKNKYCVFVFRRSRFLAECIVNALMDFFCVIEMQFPTISL